jgi:hypothetical protein
MASFFGSHSVQYIFMFSLNLGFVWAVLPLFLHISFLHESVLNLKKWSHVVQYVEKFYLVHLSNFDFGKK